MHLVSDRSLKLSNSGRGWYMDRSTFSSFTYFFYIYKCTSFKQITEDKHVVRGMPVINSRGMELIFKGDLKNLV
jgi:hypothetical protein